MSYYQNEQNKRQGTEPKVGCYSTWGRFGNMKTSMI